MLLIRLVFLLILAALVGCNPYGFNFKKNPSFVLEEAFKAVINLDSKSFVEISGKEALCLYGNPKGLAYLKSVINLDTTALDYKHMVTSSRYTKAPEYVGYWVYYSERYLIDILEGEKKIHQMQVVVDCSYGTSGEKDKKLVNISAKDYPTKECRLVKIIPKTFDALPVPANCNNFKVML